MRGFTIVQLVVVGAFVLVGPWWALRAGLPGAALLVCGLGVLFDRRALDVLLPWLSPPSQRAVVRLALATHFAALTWALVMLLRPLDPAWVPLPGTEDWSDPRIAATPDGAWVVLTGSGRVYRRDDGDWQELAPAPGGFAWEFHAGPDGALWSAPRGVARIDRRDPGSGAWRSLGRLPGELAALAVGADELLAVVGGAPHRFDMSSGTWSKIPVISGPTHGVVLARDGAALVLGRRWWSREAGVWTEVTPPGEVPRADAAIAGGWRYAWSGGLWSGDLLVAPPGEAFVRRPVPAPDLRVLVPDPGRGERAVAGSWGQGVFLTEDGGRTWVDLGLWRVQVHSLAVDWRQGAVCVTSSNLVWDRGLYCRDLPHGHSSGSPASP